MSAQMIGSYQIISELGRGGMATVYRAFQPAFNRYIALKVLPAHLAHDQTFVARFSREAQIAAGLKHPNIVEIYEVSTAEPYYLAMQLVEGETLAAIIRREGKLEPSRAAAILQQVANALDYAHARGVVHRDVKPSNILLDHAGRAILSDFGIAKAVEGTRITQTGVAMGTPEYMSPEQGQGKPADARSDIYSLGIVVYEMLTGRVPFHADTPLATLHQQVYDPPPPPRRLNPRLSPEMEHAVLKALAKDPRARFANGQAMALALQRSLGVRKQVVQPATQMMVTGKTVGAPTHVAERQARRSVRSPLAIVLGVMVIVVIVVLGVLGTMPKGLLSQVAARGPVSSPTATVVPAILIPVPTDTPIPPISTPTDTPTLLPTYTPKPPTATATISSDPTVYDNFNNPAFDGAFNRGRWYSSDVSPVRQQNGVLVFLRDPSAVQRDRALEAPSRTVNELGFLEAKLRIGNDYVGENSTSAKIQVMSQLRAYLWWTSCTLTLSPRRPFLICDVSRGSGDNFEYQTPEVSARYDTWYTVRIEIDAATFNLRFYVENQLLGSYVPKDAAELRESKLRPRVGLFQQTNSSATAYIDDVRMGR